MKAVNIKEGIYWVGGIDWNVRSFHGYSTQRGSTYNAYLVIDEKITLIDTVKGYLADEMMSRISSIVDPARIDYIVSNHVEMDHSGALPQIMEIAKNATIITCASGEKGLRAHYKKDWSFKVVKSGDNIELGKRSLEFLLTPMVHWPDNMVCYMPQEKILFSNDSFGQHLASSERFDDEYPIDIVMEEARKYYANIVLPYGMQVQKELEAAKGLDIEMIATSHGIIWRSHIQEIMSLYADWASNRTSKKAVIVYDSMWKSTETMASSIKSAFEEKGYVIRYMNLEHNHISDVMTEIMDAEYICVGSPTLNNNMLPTVAAFLAYLKGLAPKGRKAIAFGSFGWGGQSIGLVKSELELAGCEVMSEIKQQYVPSSEELKNIEKTVLEII
ncbi:rubredoxin-oxygen oxidoreductase, putative [Peptoclostridium acidaminophilum DSM 3953]|uniref:Rubredoxin-oxygen oxidoreductase, putative n=1 Tax=Peptoclostridium acidaminophilum DSM 3953 TaxID=1286171 RepID=W8THB0_PEPAC|nr:FprA family A-type flavoprotein [Peptoclostridium acidaminophilum]AHM55577.1 rubredoxin-oxygen oxidoreductase, putative [Peptoclostridium acidaminophilum DSM 3953]